MVGHSGSQEVGYTGPVSTVPRISSQQIVTIFTQASFTNFFPSLNIAVGDYCSNDEK